MKRMQQPVISLVGAAVIAVIGNQVVHAGAFSLYTEGSGASIGNYGAGLAAEAADASTAWYNPAGLVLLKKQQVVLSGVGIFPSSKLTGTSTFSTPPASYVKSFTDLQGGRNALVPALHYALPLGERIAFGFSVVSPFGLSTRYGESSPVRYAATLTELRTIDVSPDISGKLTDNVSFGLGLDFQYAKIKFNGVLGAPTLPFFNPFITSPTAFDSSTYNIGNSFGMGFHTGILGVFNDNHTRLGLNYQSNISHRFRGTSTLVGPLADTSFPPVNANATYSTDNLFSNAISLPDLLTLSGYHDVNDRLAVLGSVIYTGWSSFKTLQLNNVATEYLSFANSTSTENYRDAWRFGLGANYRVNEKLMMRAGGGYDQTPTVNSARDVRLPDVSRWALAIGAHYQLYPSVGVDVGYSYLFAANDSVVNKTQAVGTTSTYNVNSTGKVHAQLVGLQVSWAVDQVPVVSEK